MHRVCRLSFDKVSEDNYGVYLLLHLASHVALSLTLAQGSRFGELEFTWKISLQ